MYKQAHSYSKHRIFWLSWQSETQIPAPFTEMVRLVSLQMQSRRKYPIETRRRFLPPFSENVSTSYVTGAYHPILFAKQIKDNKPLKVVLEQRFNR